MGKGKTTGRHDGAGKTRRLGSGTPALARVGSGGQSDEADIYSGVRFAANLARHIVGSPSPTSIARPLLVLLALAAIELVGAAQAQGSAGPNASMPVEGPNVLVVDGRVRGYELHLPVAARAPGADAGAAGDATGATEAGSAAGAPDVAGAPLVILLHGRGGTGAGMRDITDFDAVADAHGLVVAYPDGIAHEWNYTRGLPGYEKVEDADRDDVVFLATLAEHLVTSLGLDADRTYLVGFSNGGFMTNRVACERPDLFAAYGSVGGAGFGGMTQLCSNEAPAAFLVMHGTADPIVPWDGFSVRSEDGREAEILMSVPHAFAYWATRAGCDDEGQRSSIPETGASPGTRVELLGVGGCATGGQVILVAVVGGGHVWPGVRSLPEESLGRVNMDIDAGDMLWGFFEANPRRHAP